MLGFTRKITLNTHIILFSLRGIKHKKTNRESQKIVKMAKNLPKMAKNLPSEFISIKF